MNVKSAYWWFLAQSMARLYLLALAAILCTACCWWYFVYQPLARSIAYGEKNVDQLLANLIIVKKSRRELATLTKKISALKKSTPLQMQKKSIQEIRQESLAFLADSALEVGMQVGSCRLTQDHTKNKITFNSHGTFDQMILFFEKIKKESYNFDCEMIQIARTVGDGNSLHVVLKII